MERLKVLISCLFLWAQLSSALAQTQPAARTKPTTSLQIPKSTYFFMDPNGSYKYAFDTGSGFMSEQIANQANEVVGHYIYQEKGVPYMVKYKSGVQGYQPEVITASTLPITNSGKAPGATPLLQQLPAVQTNLVANYVPTLKFVQDAMAAMKTQPMKLSFVAHHTGLQQATSHELLKPPNPSPSQLNAPSKLAVTLNPPNSQSTELNQLNTLSPPTPSPLPKRPYAFSYLSDQSTRSESGDAAGNVMGKYAYYDEAGFHDLSYKAGDGIGFVILGGSLLKPKLAFPPPPAPVSMTPPLVVNVSHLPPYSADAANLIKRSADGTVRSLRKFRHYTRW